MKHKQSPGFTVVELLTTLVIASIYITVFFQLYVLTTNVSDNAFKLAATNQIVYRKVQQYENRNFSAIPITSGSTLTEVEDFTSELPAGLSTPREAKVFTAQITPTLKAVTVRAKYGPADSGQRIIEYSDYIQEGGLGR